MIASFDLGPGMLVCIVGFAGSLWKTDAFARNAELVKLRQAGRELHRRAKAWTEEGLDANLRIV